MPPASSPNLKIYGYFPDRTAANGGAAHRAWLSWLKTSKKKRKETPVIYQGCTSNASTQIISNCGTMQTKRPETK